MRILLLHLFSILPFLGSTQIVKPAVFNTGGGASAGLPVNAEWSIGETAAIGSFLNGNFQLNIGVLQPKTDLVTSVTELGIVAFGNQILITPNPSYDNVKIVFRMQKPGKAILSVFNSASQLYKRVELDEIGLQQTKTVVLDDLPVGLYLFDIVYQPTIGLVQHGIYKIIRL
jgi:hypothetical protein